MTDEGLEMAAKASETATVEERFWARVRKTDGCWEWTGSRRAGGYGCLKVDGKNIQAHRLAWELSYGSLPDGPVQMDGAEDQICVSHTCGNSRCVRPDHLRLASLREIRGRGGRRGGRDESRRGQEHRRPAFLPPTQQGVAVEAPCEDGPLVSAPAILRPAAAGSRASHPADRLSDVAATLDSLSVALRTLAGEQRVLVAATSILAEWLRAVPPVSTPL